MVKLSGFRKPATKEVGVKILVTGATGTGKTLFSLSMPKSLAMDSEAGIAFYEGKPEGKNLLGVKNTQSFSELNETMDEIMELIEDEEELGFQTLIIDSETKFYQNLTDTALQLEEKKARNKGRDVMDSAVSMRGWGRIKSVATRLQNLKIDLSGRGVNIVSVSQVEDVKEKIGDNFVKTGEKPVMQKNSSYDYDIVIDLFTEEEDGDVQFKGRILKDRTRVTKVGQIIQNPSYEIWKDYIESREGGGFIDSNLRKDLEVGTKALEEEEKSEASVIDQIKELVKKSDEHKKFIAGELKKNKLKISALKPEDYPVLEGILDIAKDI